MINNEVDCTHYTRTSMIHYENRLHETIATGQCVRASLMHIVHDSICK